MTMRPARARVRPLVRRSRGQVARARRRPRVGGAIRGPQPRRRDVGVDLGRREAAVPEQLLDDPQVGPAVEEVGREAVAEGVRRDADRQAGPAPQPLEPEAQAARAERGPEVVQEELARLGSGRAASAPGGARRRRSSRAGRPSARYSASAARAGRPSSPIRSLRPLPMTRSSPRRRSRSAAVARRQLADPQPGGVGGLDDRPVAQGERAAQVVAGGPAAPARGPVSRRHVVVDRGQEPLDLLDLEDAGQAARQARRRERAPRIARRRDRLARREPVERAEGGESLGDRAPGVAVAQRSRGRPAAGAGPGVRQSIPRSSSQAR